MKRIAAPMVGGIFTSFLMELVVYPPDLRHLEVELGSEASPEEEPAGATHSGTRARRWGMSNVLHRLVETGARIDHSNAVVRNDLGAGAAAGAGICSVAGRVRRVARLLSAMLLTERWRQP